MLGVELTAARLRRAVHLSSAVVADSGRREATGGRAGARAWAERRYGLHVVPDERPVGARAARAGGCPKRVRAAMSGRRP